MPEYTQEQIENAKAQATFCVANGHLVPNKCGSILLSALSTAERERDEERRQRKSAEQDINSAFNCLAVLGVQRERAGTIGNGIMVYEERMSKQATSDRVAKDEALAQVAELEARLQGTAETAEAFGRKSGMNYLQLIEMRAAIVGKKEG